MNAWQSLTPWFPIQTPPVRSGVYLVDGGKEFPNYFRYFNIDTGSWGAMAFSVRSAHDRRSARTHGAYLNAARWRGIQGE